MKATDGGSRRGRSFEKRNNRRYHVKSVTWAVLDNGSGTVTAQVMDIGISGLSIHSASRLRIGEGFFSLDLIVSRNGFQIERLPFQTVSSTDLPPQIPFGPKKWRYGLKFGRLSPKQHAALEAFISRHTIRHHPGPLFA